MKEQALFIMRNPFDAFVAEYKRRKTGQNHLGQLSISHFGMYVHNSILWQRVGIDLFYVLGSNNSQWDKSVTKFASDWYKLAKITISRHLRDHFQLHIIR